MCKQGVALSMWNTLLIVLYRVQNHSYVLKYLKWATYLRGFESRCLFYKGKQSSSLFARSGRGCMTCWSIQYVKPIGCSIHLHINYNVMSHVKSDKVYRNGKCGYTCMNARTYTHAVPCLGCWYNCWWIGCHPEMERTWNFGASEK